MKLVILFIFIISTSSWAGPGKVGNGDDGSDLENFNEVKSGRLITSRDAALKKIQTLNTAGIPKLGALGPELENSKIYFTKKNISAEKLDELGAYHSGMQRLVYARTFATAYSPTRFFPAAMDLSKTQLIALHIHEALHRSLPKKYREDEKIVSKITLSIVSPGATYDSIKAVVTDLLQDDETSFLNRNSKKPAYLEAKIIKNASSSEKNGSPNFTPLDLMYGLSSKIYPLKNKFSSVGMGIDLSFFKNDHESFLGPLGLSLSGQVFTLNGFDGELYFRWGRNSGSSKKLQSVLVARDNFRVGLQLFKDQGSFEILNQLEFMKEHKENKTLAGSSYQFKFGSVTKTKIEVLKKINDWAFGSALSLYLIGPTEVTGALRSSAQRGTILSLDPKLRFTQGRHVYSMGLSLPLSINDSDFNNIGDFVDGAPAQASVSLKYRFLF